MGQPRPSRVTKYTYDSGPRIDVHVRCRSQHLYRGKDAVVWARGDKHRLDHGVLHISTILGHVETSTTAIYTGVPVRQLKQVHDPRIWVRSRRNVRTERPQRRPREPLHTSSRAASQVKTSSFLP